MEGLQVDHTLRSAMIIITNKAQDDYANLFSKYLPETQEEASRSGKKKVFSSWTLSAEQAEKQHCDQSSKAQQSSMLE